MLLERWKSNPARILALVITNLGLCIAAYAAPQYKVLHNFTGGTDGTGNTGVIGEVLRSAKGVLFGTTAGYLSYTGCDCGSVWSYVP